MRYRFSQFWRHFKAKPLPPDLREDASSILSEVQLKLFEQLPVEDQDHSYQVMDGLRKAGEVEPDLLAAALLHDVGKTRAPVTVWERSLVVLLENAFPEKAKSYGEGSPKGWRRAFVVKAQHPIWGAELAQQSGCSELTVSLIRRHHESLTAQEETEEDQFLRVLQEADNCS